MPISQATLANRLKDARINARKTQEEAASVLNVPRTAIVHLEKGSRSVSTLELVLLADLYERTVQSFIAEETERLEDPLMALYRIDATFRDDVNIKEHVSKCIDVCKEGKVVEDLLELSRRAGPPAYSLPNPESTGDAVTQGEITANQERKRLALGNSPIPDIAELITDQGVWASGVTLPQAFSGLFFSHPATGMVVLVNVNHGRARKRFSYAHEYGHCLMDRKEILSITTSENRTALSEVRANAFAAAFLMPGDGVASFLDYLNKGAPSRQSLTIYDNFSEQAERQVEAQNRPASGSQKIICQNVAELAHHFGVSYQAATYRLRGLGRINKVECESLIQLEDVGRRYLKLMNLLDDLEGKESSRPDRELVKHVIQVAIEGFRRNKISRGRLLEISKKLNVSGSEVLAIAQAST